VGKFLWQPVGVTGAIKPAGWVLAVISILGVVLMASAAWLPSDIKETLKEIPLVQTCVVPLVAESQAQWFHLTQQWHGSQSYPLFNASGGLSREDARKRYLQGVTAYNEGRYPDALLAWAALEKVYPAMLDLLLFHEAEAYEKQGNEWQAQQRLIRLIQERPQSVLLAKARYELAQSYFRGKQPKSAMKQFLRVRQYNPHSAYAVGSLYYLGLLAQQYPDDSVQLKSPPHYWWQYLAKSPDGRYALEIATQLDQPKARLKPSQHLGLGLAYAAADSHWSQVIGHLTEAPIQKAWLALGKAYLKEGQAEKGQLVLAENITAANDKKTFQEAVDLLVRNTDQSRLVPMLKVLAGHRLPEGGDYLLWKLAYFVPEQKNAYYRQIIEQFPKGDYAPESLWQQLREHIKAQRWTNYLEDSTHFLSRYSYAQSAPKALFWQGKIYEKQSNLTKAIQTYEYILNTYPHSYYAFRANGRLSRIRDNGVDAGWMLLTQNNYPPTQKPAFSLVRDLPQLSSAVRPTCEELEAIGAGDDLTLVLSESMEKLPAEVTSWASHQKQERNVGIKTIREALLDEARTGNLNAFKPNQSVQQLLYPLVFEDVIAAQAQANGINPWIAQSLMREESFFNPLAVSSSNALGLMQLLPATAGDVAGWLGIAGFDAVQLFQPETNITLGTRYLRYLFERFNSYGSKIQPMLAVGGYNGGPNAMAGWASQSNDLTTDPDRFVELIPYDQTREYIEKVFGSYWNYTRLYGHP